MSLRVHLLLDYRGVKIYRYHRSRCGKTVRDYVTGVHGQNAETLANEFEPIEYNGQFNPALLNRVKTDIDHILDNNLLRYVPSEKSEALAREILEEQKEVRNETETY